jgi:hypothetical protein
MKFKVADLRRSHRLEAAWRYKLRSYRSSRLQNRLLFASIYPMRLFAEKHDKWGLAPAQPSVLEALVFPAGAFSLFGRESRVATKYV